MDPKRPLTAPSLTGLRPASEVGKGNPFGTAATRFDAAQLNALGGLGPCVVCEGVLAVTEQKGGASAAFFCTVCGISYAAPPGLRCECGEFVASPVTWAKAAVHETTEHDEEDVEEEFIVRHRRPPLACSLAEDEN
jgi:hypothetical protein